MGTGYYNRSDTSSFMSGWNDQYRDPALIPAKILRMMPPEERKRLGKGALLPEEKQAKEKARRETELQQRIASMLRIRGVTFCNPRSDRESTVKLGWPDFTFCIDGVPCAVEVKMPGEDPRPEQVQCMEGLRRDGWTVEVIRSEAEFVEFIRRAVAKAERIAGALAVTKTP